MGQRAQYDLSDQMLQDEKDIRNDFERQRVAFHEARMQHELDEYEADRRAQEKGNTAAYDSVLE